jgi:hypothetical protein
MQYAPPRVWLVWCIAATIMISVESSQQCAFDSSGPTTQGTAPAAANPCAVSGPQDYDKLCDKLKELSSLEGISGLLGWDEMWVDSSMHVRVLQLVAGTGAPQQPTCSLPCALVQLACQ